MAPAESGTTLCLTLDVDWAHDAVIRDSINLLQGAGVKATWFVTHATPTINELRAVPGQEIGVHPNFNPILAGGRGDAREVLQDVMRLVPEARCVRSHSLVASSRLSLLFAEQGFTHQSNVHVPPSAARSLGPWRDFSGLVQVPIVWEDDLRLLDPALGEPADTLGQVRWLTVDFHPIHIFLNTCSIEDYEAARPDFADPAALLSLRRPTGSGGTRDRLLALLDAAAARRVPTACVGEATPSDLRWEA